MVRQDAFRWSATAEHIPSWELSISHAIRFCLPMVVRIDPLQNIRMTNTVTMGRSIIKSGYPKMDLTGFWATVGPRIRTDTARRPILMVWFSSVEHFREKCWTKISRPGPWNFGGDPRHRLGERAVYRNRGHAACGVSGHRGRACLLGRGGVVAVLGRRRVLGGSASKVTRMA